MSRWHRLAELSGRSRGRPRPEPDKAAVLERDAGNAILEFVVLGVLLMVPLIFIVLAVFRVQGSAYGVTEAAREAGRSFVHARSSDDAYAQACTAATVALENQIPDPFDCQNLRISCLSGNCLYDAASGGIRLTAGTTIRVEIDLAVSLPMLPSSVFGNRLAVHLHSVHDEVVDVFTADR